MLLLTEHESEQPENRLEFAVSFPEKLPCDQFHKLKSRRQLQLQIPFQVLPINDSYLMHLLVKELNERLFNLANSLTKFSK